MRRKIIKLILLVFLTQINAISMHEVLKDAKEYFSPNYLPEELQLHILKSVFKTLFYNNSPIEEVIEHISVLLKNTRMVNKLFHSFQKEIVESLKDNFMESLLIPEERNLVLKYMTEEDHKKNQMLIESLTSEEKDGKNTKKGLMAIFSGADANLSLESDLKTKRPALGWAVMLRSPELIVLLLLSGAKINFQNTNGYTALIQAVLLDYEEIVKILLQFGADASLSTNDKKPKTALNLAKENKNVRIIEMLSKKY